MFASLGVSNYNVANWRQEQLSRCHLGQHHFVVRLSRNLIHGHYELRILRFPKKMCHVVKITIVISCVVQNRPSACRIGPLQHSSTFKNILGEPFPTPRCSIHGGHDVLLVGARLQCFLQYISSNKHSFGAVAYGSSTRTAREYCYAAKCSAR